MVGNKLRYGNITSSGIVALTSKNKKGDDFGAAAKTYIEEKKMEIRLQRSLETETKGRAALWGTFLESFVFSDILDMGYSYNSEETLTHPTILNWRGTPDGFKYDLGKTVADTKCPYTLKSFCQLVQPLYDGLTGMDAMNAIRFGYTDKNGFEHSAHKEGETYFRQLVSNAIIADCRYAELIVFCPFLSQLESIKSLAEGQADYYFIWAANNNELPYLIDNGYYNNINIIRFEVEQSDKEELTELVEKANKTLLTPTLQIDNKN